jgi:hypothetical protein
MDVFGINYAEIKGSIQPRSILFLSEMLLMQLFDNVVKFVASLPVVFLAYYTLIVLSGEESL